MSTPSGDPGNQWTPPTGYGTPSSPSYGKYGQGQAEPTAPASQPDQPSWGQPGYVKPTGWQHGSADFKASGGLCPAVIVLSVLYTVLTWLTVIVQPEQETSLADALEGNQVAETTFGAAELISLLGIPVLIGVWIVTSVWLTRARANAVILRPEGQRRSEGWAWFGWVLPIVYLWFPKQILDDTTAATGPASGDTQPVSTNTYWTLWVTSIVLGVASATTNLLDDGTGALALGYGEAIALTVALVPWIQVVQRISAAQDKLAGGGPTAPAPPTLEQ